MAQRQITSKQPSLSLGNLKQSTHVSQRGLKQQYKQSLSTTPSAGGGGGGQPTGALKSRRKIFYFIFIVRI